MFDSLIDDIIKVYLIWIISLAIAFGLGAWIF